MIILTSILFGFHQLPLTPVQILWVNMITAVTLALALAFEPPEQKCNATPTPRCPPADIDWLSYLAGYICLLHYNGWNHGAFSLGDRSGCQH